MTRVGNAVGAYGERVAERVLTEAGMSILARNWRCSLGELDLIAQDGGTIVFCEVKTRRSDRFGPPAGAVTRRKATRLRALAVAWLAANPVPRHGIRFDVVSVRTQPTGPAKVEHLRGVI